MRFYKIFLFEGNFKKSGVGPVIFWIRLSGANKVESSAISAGIVGFCYGI